MQTQTNDKDLQSQLVALTTRLNQQEDQLRMLRKVADKKKLARLVPESARGQSCLISLFRREQSEKPKIVKSWKMIKDEVRVGRNGIEEDQQVVITLEDKEEVKLTYKEFFSDWLEKKTCNVVGTKNHFGRNFLIVDYEGREVEIGIEYIN